MNLNQNYAVVKKNNSCGVKQQSLTNFIFVGSLHSGSPMSGKSSVSMDDGSHVLSSASCPMAVKVHTDFIPGKTDSDFLKLEVSVHIYQGLNL